MSQIKKFAKKLVNLKNNNVHISLIITRSYAFDSNISDNKLSGEKVLKSNLSGIYPAICTPFKRLKSETISFTNLEKNLINWSTINFHGYSVHGYFGEYPYLSNEERLEIIKFIRNIIGVKKKIISGSSSESLKKTIDICELMAKSGADYSLLFTPHYYKKQMTYTALFDYYTKVADKSPLPIILHNIPPVTFIDMPIELIIDLADHPNIVGLKECSHNIAKIACICEQLNKKDSDFNVFSGSASFILDALKVGASGSINAVSAFLGHMTVELYDLFIAERSLIKNDQTTEEIKALKEHREKMKNIQEKLIAPDLIINEYGVAGLKAALDMFGYYGGPCRLPLSDLTEEEINNFKLIMQQSDNRLGNNENISASFSSN